MATTGKKLLIVESPAKARTIGQYLGSEYTVLASVGHVRDLPKSNKDAVDVEHGFKPKYVISPGKKDVIEKIKKAASKASEVYLATDPDREGEAISWHIEQAVGLSNPKRVVFHEITKDAVQEALAHPREIDQRMRQAQEARRVLDRLVGYDLSGLIWKKVRYGLSAGRVQSPALRILAEREREILAFVPETYYTIDARFKAHGEEFPATCSVEPKTASEAERIVTLGEKASWKIASVTESEQDRHPRPPFTTSTLQQAASTRLGFSPSRTMRAAQKLYEGGHITYMRTDSVNISKEAIGKLAGVVLREFGKEYVHVRTFKTKSKNAQEAHEAVRPTDPLREHAGHDGDEERLYTLIRTRALASQMASARVLRTKVEIEANADIPMFTSNGARITFPGWLALDTKARSEDVELPKLSKGEPVELVTLGSLEKQTEPPSRYTEAGLVKELEKRGIGRPSTYASIMQTIQVRGYAEKAGRTLTPTAIGMVVSGFLETHFAEYISDSFTAEMEDELDDIARGDREYEATLRDFYTPFQKAVLGKEDLPKATALGEAPAEFPCPLCGAQMEYKLGRGGVFMSCSRYPECEGARQENGSMLKSDEPIGIHPETGKPVFVKTGRFGPYVEMVLGQEEEKPLLTKSGKPSKRKPKKPKMIAKRASVPAGVEPEKVTLEEAVKYLSLPRDLGAHPETGLPITASTGRFGPFLAHKGEFRSIKKGDPYTITLDEAVTVLNQPKKPPRGVEIVKEIGAHPKTGRSITLYKSKQGLFLKKGLKRIYMTQGTTPDEITPEIAAQYLK